MRFFALLAVLLTVSPAFAAPADMDDRVAGLREKLAEIRYAMTDEDVQLRTLDILNGQAEKLAADFPGKAEPLIVEAAIHATRAELVGGPSALGDAKQARDLAQAAEKIQPGVLGGTAQAIMGALYHAVPGWPISFGDDDKARKLLRSAHAIDPANINTDYYLADYLHDKGEDAEARALLDQALNTLHGQPQTATRDGKIAAFEKLRGKLSD